MLHTTLDLISLADDHTYYIRKYFRSSPKSDSVTLRDVTSLNFEQANELVSTDECSAVGRYVCR
jgi:hypothetical protein